MKYYGDYIGFQFGDYHSHDLGLIRVSDGSRYQDVSVPNFQDVTQKRPGGDGTYYWGATYTQRTFPINIAFDNLSEEQLRQVRNVYTGDAEGWLIFDETPYKKYWVKLQSPPQFKYLTFTENGNDRVYKGEATLTFISYSPYAIDAFKYLEDAQITKPVPISSQTEYQSLIQSGQYMYVRDGVLYSPGASIIPISTTSYNYIDPMNEGEWIQSVKLLDNDDSIISTAAATTFYVYNPGDLPTDCIITIALTSEFLQAAETRVRYIRQPGGTENTLGRLHFKQIIQQDPYDAYIKINTGHNLVYGADANGIQTGSLYNSFITEGDFFKIAVSTVQGEALTSSEQCDYIVVHNTASGNARVYYDCACEYNYLYY